VTAAPGAAGGAEGAGAAGGEQRARLLGGFHFQAGPQRLLQALVLLDSLRRLSGVQVKEHKQAVALFQRGVALHEPPRGPYGPFHVPGRGLPRGEVPERFVELLPEPLSLQQDPVVGHLRQQLAPVKGDRLLQRPARQRGPEPGNVGFNGPLQEMDGFARRVEDGAALRLLLDDVSDLGQHGAETGPARFGVHARPQHLHERVAWMQPVRVKRQIGEQRRRLLRADRGEVFVAAPQAEAAE
jgi:hypothetical protein